MDTPLLAIFTYDLTQQHLALSASKALQILVPLGLFIALRELLRRRWLYLVLARRLHPREGEWEQRERGERYEQRAHRLLGFIAWKVGCDLGFFLLMGESWLRAITPAGLIPYTIAQYLIYRIIGQKMILGGMVNPFRPEKYHLPRLERRKPMQRLVARFLHEDMNAPSPHAPMRPCAASRLNHWSTTRRWLSRGRRTRWEFSGSNREKSTSSH